VKTILFLCTGNYYRSRFAEELFNHHALLLGLDWMAESRGLALERGTDNVGPISPFALHALKERAIAARGADRVPQQCILHDLASADLIIALKEAEHRPLIRERFPEWEHLSFYWDVHDLDAGPPAQALGLIAQEVQTLTTRFRSSSI
jgi:protein-tyrosine phosphatase